MVVNVILQANSTLVNINSQLRLIKQDPEHIQQSKTHPRRHLFRCCVLIKILWKNVQKENQFPFHELKNLIYDKIT